jgi:hypothetical protein
MCKPPLKIKKMEPKTNSKIDSTRLFWLSLNKDLTLAFTGKIRMRKLSNLSCQLLLSLVKVYQIL